MEKLTKDSYKKANKRAVKSSFIVFVMVWALLIGANQPIFENVYSIPELGLFALIFASGILIIAPVLKIISPVIFAKDSHERTEVFKGKNIKLKLITVFTCYTMLMLIVMWLILPLGIPFFLMLVGGIALGIITGALCGWVIRLMIRQENPPFQNGSK